MDDDAPLFPVGDRHSHGRVRKGLDADARAAIADGGQVAAAGLAACRSLADQIDQLERQLRSPYAKPYDRVPLASLVREFRETYDATFAATQRAADPLTHALAAFLAADSAAAPGDTPGPEPAQ